jgi:Putative transposase
LPAWRRAQHLCRYITRPAIANERLTLNRAGQVVLTLKTPYRDGTTHIVTAGIHAATRCADPPSRLHLIRFHGVLAPNARLRPEIIPTVPVNAHPPSADHAEAPPAAAPARLSWARLLKRVFDIDLEHCPRCGGPLKIIAAPSTGSGQASNIPPSLRRILAHLGLLARAPHRSLARAFHRSQLA